MTTKRLALLAALLAAGCNSSTTAMDAATDRASNGGPDAPPRELAAGGDSQPVATPDGSGAGPAIAAVRITGSTALVKDYWILPGDFLTIEGTGLGTSPGSVSVDGVDQSITSWSATGIVLRVDKLAGLSYNEAAILKVKTAGGGTAAVTVWLNLPVGFGAGTVGGLKASAVTLVTNAGSSGAGSLREALTAPGPAFIRFQKDLTIDLQSEISMASDKTVDGRGVKLLIRRFHLQSYSKQQIILSNLAFTDMNYHADNNHQDAIEIRATSYGATPSRFVFIDHCRTSNVGDEHIEMGHNSTDVTIAWHFFDDSSKLGRRYQLIMGFDASQDDSNARLTLHHSYSHSADQRCPRMRYGKVHIFNNYFYGWQAYVIGADQQCQAHVERNVFDPTTDDGPMTLIGPPYGYIKNVDNGLLGGVSLLENEPQNVFSPATYYAYKADPADAALKARVAAGAGPR